MFRRIVSALLVLTMLSGCATVRTPLPPSDYKQLPLKQTFRVTTKDGTVRESYQISTPDSAMVILRPADIASDRRRYPVVIPYDDIESVEIIKHENRLGLQTGVIAGSNFGAPSNEFSDIRVLLEPGYVSGVRQPVDVPRWDTGGTLYIAFGEEDTRFGVRAHAVYRKSDALAFDLGAGPLFGWWDGSFINGFVGGVGIDVFSWLTLRSEYMAYHVNGWPETVYSNTSPSGRMVIQHSDGYEQVWYNGATLRGTSAWATMGFAGVLVGVALLALIISAPHF